MTTFKRNASFLLLVAALAAAGCGGGGGDQVYNPPAPPAPPAPPPPSAEGFTNWFKVSVFSQPAAGTPIEMETLVFNFDSNDNPDAYSELLPVQ